MLFRAWPSGRPVPATETARVTLIGVRVTPGLCVTIRPCTVGGLIIIRGNMSSSTIAGCHAVPGSSWADIIRSLSSSYLRRLPRRSRSSRVIVLRPRADPLVLVLAVEVVHQAGLLGYGRLAKRTAVWTTCEYTWSASMHRGRACAGSGRTGGHTPPFTTADRRSLRVDEQRSVLCKRLAVPPAESRAYLPRSILAQLRPGPGSV